jgi:hypothetical protein
MILEFFDVLEPESEALDTVLEDSIQTYIRNELKKVKENLLSFDDWQPQKVQLPRIKDAPNSKLKFFLFKIPNTSIVYARIFCDNGSNYLFHSKSHSSVLEIEVI